MISAIEKSLGRITVVPGSEKELQAWIAAAFLADGLPFEREVATETGPADFVVDKTCLVEVKMHGSAMAAARQVARYLDDDRFACGVVVSTRPMVLPLAEVGGKPIHQVELWRNFF